MQKAEAKTQTVMQRVWNYKLFPETECESQRPQLALSAAIWDLNKYFDAVKIQMGIQVAQK